MCVKAVTPWTMIALFPYFFLKIHSCFEKISFLGRNLSSNILESRKILLLLEKKVFFCILHIFFY